MPGDTYRPPILASIFRGFGWLSVVGALVLLFVALAMLGERGRHRDLGVETLPLLIAGFAPVVSAVASALFFFGIGQLIDFFGQTAFNSGKIRESIDQLDALAPVRWREVQAALDKIATQSRQTLPQGNTPTTSPQRSAPPPAPPTGPPARRFFYLDLDNQVAGPVTEPKLRQLSVDGSISEETQICLEGSDQWQPLTKAVLL